MKIAVQQINQHGIEMYIAVVTSQDTVIWSSRAYWSEAFARTAALQIKSILGVRS